MTHILKFAAGALALGFALSACETMEKNESDEEKWEDVGDEISEGADEIGDAMQSEDDDFGDEVGEAGEEVGEELDDFNENDD